MKLLMKDNSEIDIATEVMKLDVKSMTTASLMAPPLGGVRRHFKMIV